MPKKYRFVPQRTNHFGMLLPTMELPPEERRICQNTFIRHVEVSPQTKTWEVLLEVETLIGEALLARAARYIRQRFDLAEVLFYQNVLNLEASLDKDWPRLLKMAVGTNQLLRALLSQAEHHFDGGRLLVRVGHATAGPMLEEKRIAERLQQAVGELTGCYCEVACECYDGEMPAPDCDAVISSSTAFQEAVKKAKNPIPATSPGTNGNGRGRRKKTPTAEGCLFGGGVAGDPVSIGDIANEMKQVVVIGQVEAVDGREFRETNLLTLEIADDTQGITVKSFFRDKEEYDKVRKELKQGQLVRVRGAVRYDTYMNDLVLMADSLRFETAEKRMDQAEETRVELHAHTQMSLLDAVVSAENLIRTAASWGWPAIAITDHGVVQAFPEAMQTVQKHKLDIKVIYGMEGYLVGEDYKQRHANHIILLAKNRTGLFNLYRLISLSHLRFFHKRPRIPKKILNEFREGLIVGSACEAGELIRAIVEHRSEEALLEIARFYDYLEIQPVGNNAFLVRSDAFPDVKNDDDLRAINRKVAELAKKLGKMLVATGDVHFLNPEDAIYRAVIMAGHGFTDADLQPPLYLKTTAEMLEEFSYLGEQEAYDAVVRNPRRISDMIQRLDPLPEEDNLYSPMISGAAEQIRDMSYKRAREMYGENLPEIVQARLDQELKPIISHGFSVLYLIAHKLVKKSNLDGYLVGSRGSVGSSFVATMTDITEVNPLPPHWRCPACKYSQFLTDGSYGSGFDLPDRDCPVCGTPLIKDGHDIPFAVFLGFNGDKVPDIDLNFASVYQSRAQKYTEELFGRDNAYRAGTIAKVAAKTAYGLAKKYYEEHGQTKREAFIQRIKNGCMGTKQTTGQHPAGVMIVPRDMDIHFFTPIQRPADKVDSDIVTTHFDYHSISGRIVKLDNLGHDDPTVIKLLEELTHRDPKTIPFDDPATLSLFHSTEALGLTPEELGATSGTFGIPEFRTSFTRQMIDDTHPSCFSDLVRISGFSHGTDVWLGNAQELIRAGTCTLQDAISARDDIMMYLIHKGVEPLLSFKTMERVRKGKGIDPEVAEKLRGQGVPEWYITACNKIQYLFPRAHATAYVMMAYRIAFCKVHYPLAFYAAYFSIRADAFDAKIIAGGKEAVHQALQRLEAMDNKPDDLQKKLIIVLQLAWEMYLRGFSMEPVDLYRSDAEQFILLEKSLLPPFTAIKGFGAVAARNLTAARREGPFSSVADLKKRAGISKTNIELLMEHGCLEGLSESDQMALF